MITELNCCRFRGLPAALFEKPGKTYSFTQFEKSDIIIIIENENHYCEEAAKLIELIKKEYNLVSEAKHERTT